MGVISSNRIKPEVKILDLAGYPRLIHPRLDRAKENSRANPPIEKLNSGSAQGALQQKRLNAISAMRLVPPKIHVLARNCKDELISQKQQTLHKSDAGGAYEQQSCSVSSHQLREPKTCNIEATCGCGSKKYPKWHVGHVNMD